MTQNDDGPGHVAPFETEGVPERALRVYARLWQFETWLRHMAYTELRALLGDGWSTSLKTSMKSFEADKHLSHMPTPEMNALSYAPLSALTSLVKEHWDCFKGYLHPADIWEAKLKEVSQIRHRAAHFRSGHVDDHSRLRQFLRDVDPGFWKFCTSYNADYPILPQSEDPVTSHFLPLDPLPWGEIEPGRYARVGMVDKSMVVGVTVGVLTRPWAEAGPPIEGAAGHLYAIRLTALDSRRFDYPALLAGTQRVHGHLAHISLDAFETTLRLTVPSILGATKVVELTEKFLEVARYSVSRSRDYVPGRVDAQADEWPEYVLGPTNPLTFLDPSMKCSFFSAED